MSNKAVPWPLWLFEAEWACVQRENVIIFLMMQGYSREIAVAIMEGLERGGYMK